VLRVTVSASVRRARPTAPTKTINNPDARPPVRQSVRDSIVTGTYVPGVPKTATGSRARSRAARATTPAVIISVRAGRCRTVDDDGAAVVVVVVDPIAA